MNIEENNHLSFATQSKFAMVYVENNEIIFHYSKEEIIPMVSYKWYYALENLFPFYISSIQKCLLTATTISDQTDADGHFCKV